MTTFPMRFELQFPGFHINPDLDLPGYDLMPTGISTGHPGKLSMAL